MFSWLFLNIRSNPPLSLYFKNFIFKKRMQKLKFKPGYIILWKKIRLILMQWIGVRFPYPTRFTRFLLKARYPAILTPLYQYTISIYNFLAESINDYLVNVHNDVLVLLENTIHLEKLTKKEDESHVIFFFKSVLFYNFILFTFYKI